MKYALIGCGRIAPNHIAAARNNGLEIVALCDRIREKAEALSVRFELESVNCYADADEMFAKEAIDLVAIATDSGSHAELALKALRAGKHVIVEKPMALSLDDADEMIATAAKREKLLCVCHQNRFNRSVRKLREAVVGNRFGRLFYGTSHVRWNRNADYYRQADWRGTWAKDGGALMNQCIHNIDLLRWLLGDEISEVFAFTDRLNHDMIEAEDMGIALIRTPSGAYGVIEGSTVVYPRNLEETLYLFGKDGTAKIGGKSVNQIEVWNFNDDIDEADDVIRHFSENPPNIYGFGHTPLYANMLAAISGKDALLVDGAAGRRALELVLAIYLSAASGAPVTLPLSGIATTDFEGRFDA